MYSKAMKPGVLLGPYPVRKDERQGVLDRAVQNFFRRLKNSRRSDRQRVRDFVRRVETLDQPLKKLTANALLRQVIRVREAFLQNGLQERLVATAFALVRELAERTLGQRHYPSQIIGGYIILNGMLAEMDTGEGKTLTATLPASVAALAGIPVHVITTSDYLANRDAQSMSPLYAILGLTVGTVTADMADPAARRAAYACDITYTTNKQVAFDYLRDRVSTGKHGSRLDRLLQAVGGPPTSQPVMRGLCYAIVDEADSVLIDEARTPLILSRPLADNPLTEVYEAALRLAAKLSSDADYVVDSSKGKIKLTTKGCALLAELCEHEDEFWARRRQREGLVIQALRAQQFFVCDEHYLVRDGKVQIIDENTGRLMQDRSWERGLHQLIEAREGVEVTPLTEAIVQISYQQFFHRYLRLGAMTGTATEVAHELLSTYGLKVLRVDSHRPLRRVNTGAHLYATADEKWGAIIERIQALHVTGQPILIGTRTVASSEYLSELLHAAGLKHTLLNARHDAREAEIIAGAGQQGCITIATNMAGRGTDIELGDGVVELGGLHVIMAEKNDALRIDRQLYGRCGRQGDPGSYEAFLSLQDKIVRSINADYLCLLLKRTGIAKYPALDCLGKGLVRLAQRGLENQHRRVRRCLANMDEQIEDALSFTGVS